MGRKGYVTLRGSTQLPHTRFADSIDRHISGKRALLTGNGVRTCTFGRNKLYPCKYRLARGIHFLLVGALAAADASSLETFGKGHVSRVCHLVLIIEIIT